MTAHGSPLIEHQRSKETEGSRLHSSLHVKNEDPSVFFYMVQPLVPAYPYSESGNVLVSGLLADITHEGTQDLLSERKIKISCRTKLWYCIL